MPLHPAFVIAFIAGLMGSGHISTNIYSPSLPAMVEFFDTDPASVWMTISVYLLAFAFAQLVYGPLSDRFGRRKVLMYGLVVYVIATVAGAMSTSIEALIVTRAFQGIGACAGPVIGRAIVRDLFGREEAVKVMAYVGIAIGTAPAMAPVLGGYLEDWYGWQASFAVIALFGVVMLLLTWSRLPETNVHARWNRERGGTGMLRSYARLLRNRTYIGYICTGSLVFGGLFAFMAGVPFVVIDRLGYSATEFGLFSAIPIAGYVAGSIVVTRVTGWLGLDRMMPVGVGMVCIAAATLAALNIGADPTVATLFGPVAGLAFGMAFLFPSTLSGAISIYPEIAGAGSALYGFLQMTMSFTAIQLLGAVNDGTHLPMVLVASIMTVSSAVVYVLLVGRGALIVPAAATGTPPPGPAD
jgi:DHA1 family bicyclomycin/chloramphenicol resistance-like MFS transporter